MLNTLIIGLFAIVGFLCSASVPAIPNPSPLRTGDVEHKESTVIMEEIYSAKECQLTIIPGEDFVLHIPLLPDGTEDGRHAYSIGAVSFKIEHGDCGRINVKKMSSGTQ